MAAVFVAEIGDAHRFPTARHFCSWAGLTPKHIESTATVIRGRISRAGRLWWLDRHRGPGLLHRSRPSPRPSGASPSGGVARSLA